MKHIAKSLPGPLLILLYVYAASSKLMDADAFRGQLYNQPFSHQSADILFYVLPAVELLTAGLIIFKNSYGLILSMCLLCMFTGYIGMALLHFFPRIPCSCGGILSHMSWTTHFIFNCCFIVLNAFAIRQEGEAENPVESRQTKFH